MRIITNKILLGTLLSASLFLTGCSFSEENIQEDEKSTNTSTTATEESSGFFGSLFGGEDDETPKVKETAETEGSSGFFGSWFGGDEKGVKDNSKKNLEKKKGIKSAVNKKYSKLTGKQQEIIASIKIDAEAERKRRIEAVKVGNINAKVVAKIAKQTRLEDVESRLKEELGVLNAQLKSEEGNLAKDSQAELKTKVKTLDIDIQDKVAQVKSNTKDKRVEAITSVERKISDTQSEVESRLMKKALATELDRFYIFKENERKIKGQYLGLLSVTKIELDKERKKQLTIMRQNIRAMEQSNHELLSIKMSELERQRAADAIEVEKKVKANNRAMLDKLIAKFKAEADEYSNATESKLAKQEKVALTTITSKYEEDKVARDTKEKAYKVGLNAEIVNAKKSAGDKMRSNLISERDAKINAIDERLESSIRKIYSNRKGSLSQLESDNQAQHKQKKADLKAEYEKSKKGLISQSKKDKSSIISRARTRERDLLMKERKAIEVINKQVRTDIKVKSDAALK